MARPTLKRLLKNGGEAILTALTGSGLRCEAVLEADGRLLWGAGSAPEPRWPVTLGGETLGWVLGAGGQGAAAMLSALAAKDDEVKTLAAEVLDRYRELNLLYNLTEKLTGLLEPGELADVILKEAARLIQAGSGLVVAVPDSESAAPEVLAAFGPALPDDSRATVGASLFAEVASTGKAEIVDDVTASPRLAGRSGDWRSLACAPLKSGERVIGLMALMHSSPAAYTARDLKLLTTLASQAAYQVETTMAYRRAMREAAQRAAELERQIEALLDFQIDRNRADRDVADIASSELFQSLLARRSLKRASTDT